jgi:NADPH:quinone reductase-like Zn-dependent oxidoreductase
MRGSPYLMRLSTGLGAPKDRRLGVDFAGTVTAVGSNVSQFQPGDRVFGGGSGAYADYVAIREDRAIAPIPTNISFSQAAALPIAATTALQALRDKGQLEAGQTVLINGASGGVGSFAVQIARSLGAEVTGVSSSRNIELVRSLGAHHVIDYTQENIADSERRYDLIIDNVGSQPLSRLWRLLTPGGTVVLVGAADGNWIGPLLNPLKAMAVSPLVEEEFIVLLASLNKADLVTLAELVQAGEVIPLIDRHYPLAQIATAIDYSESRRARGKIIITDHEEPAAVDSSSEEMDGKVPNGRSGQG